MVSRSHPPAARLGLLTSVLVLTAASSALALDAGSTLAVDVDPSHPGASVVTFDQTVGFEFTFSFSFSFSGCSHHEIVRLGWYDDGGDGLATSHAIAIWDTANTLTPVAQATVPAGTGAPLEGHFRWVELDPPFLPQPGTSYRIGGVSDPADGVLSLSPGGWTWTSPFGYAFACISSTSGGPQYPDQALPNQALFGPNLAYRCSGGVPYCFGDGTGIPCPCGNDGLPGHGCGHSSNPDGALLQALGAACVSDDSLRLEGSDLPTVTPALFFQGNSQIGGGLGAPFGDGLRCAGGGVVRLGVRHASGGALSFGHGNPGDPPISVKGLVPPGGGTRHYQIWFRDPPSFCTSDGFNFTNGLTIQWVP